MRRSSTLLTRLALALLAVLGFVAPLSEREADGVVQTTGGPQSAAQAVESRARLETDVRVFPQPRLPGPGPEQRSRRYLLHRAWLI